VKTAQHIAAILLVTLVTFPAAGQQAALFDELAVIYPDSNTAAGTARFAGDTPRGVPAGVHVLVTGLPPDAALNCRLTLDNAPVNSAQIYRLRDVPVEQNTGLVSRTETWDGQPNPHVIRKAPFQVFEVLEPLAEPARVDQTGVVALRVELPISADDHPGPRDYRITLQAGDWRQSLGWNLRVHKITVPPTSPRSPGYTNWFSTGLIAKRHKLEPWSEPYWQMLESYADIMARGRQNTFWIPWGNFISIDKEGNLTLNRPRFKRYVRLFLDRGFNRVESGHLAHRHQGNWSSPRLDLAFTGSDVTSEQGRADLAKILENVNAALGEIGLPPGTILLQHLVDEPTNINADSYKTLATEVRRHMPGVKIFEATMSLTLVGAVDHWCPQVQEYQRHRDFFETRKQAGDQVWVYTCLAPGGPWLNRLLDQQRLRPVYLGWSLVKYDLAGFLHWGFNHYRPGVDPFTQSVVPHGKGAPNFLPAGDSHVVYPGPNGPLSGQRFEAHRIGMEDAELLRLLIARDPTRAEAVIAQAFRAFDDYEKEVPDYRAAKRELLTTLSTRTTPAKGTPATP